ncbi:hypothetical protein HSX37_06765|uniref:Uncharacterized protein n=1 Tax=Dendrosporobacter quercicolus TaxID=146817 RepID=A0A1G9W2G4_9FIRM|nr:hypothetical protein [Dendrosporobacter quercicolus]NSL47744.1 hypothetical protein [Dendrosporobacter quercicolus DSM 1736]SDM78397.1 hypothetical protein SAMN04488502_10797 [Dendrosporobacter quercicolus]
MTKLIGQDGLYAKLWAKRLAAGSIAYTSGFTGVPDFAMNFFLLYPRVDVSLCVFFKTFCDTSFFQLTAGIHHDIINAINNNNCNYE